MNDQLQLQLQLFDNAMADICQVEYIVFLVDILNYLGKFETGLQTMCWRQEIWCILLCT